jgi:cadmium resistance protein CadD (predicted permease)
MSGLVAPEAAVIRASGGCASLVGRDSLLSQSTTSAAVAIGSSVQTLVEQRKPRYRSAVLGGAGVALLMLANNSDTLAVLASLFAETEEPLTYVIAVTVVTASVCWFGIALAVSGHSLLRRGIASLERWLVPILLIGIGLYILADTATDTL